MAPTHRAAGAHVLVCSRPQMLWLFLQTLGEELILVVHSPINSGWCLANVAGCVPTPDGRGRQELQFCVCPGMRRRESPEANAQISPEVTVWGAALFSEQQDKPEANSVPSRKCAFPKAIEFWVRCQAHPEVLEGSWPHWRCAFLGCAICPLPSLGWPGWPWESNIFSVSLCPT